MSLNMRLLEDYLCYVRSQYQVLSEVGEGYRGSHPSLQV
jgi:hypothetical protein